MKKILVILLVCLSVTAKTQPQFIFGYGFGNYTTGLNNMDFHSLQFNEFYFPHWTDKLKVNNWMRGAELEFRYRFEGFAYSFLITHRRGDSKAGGLNPATGFDEKFRLKIRTNHVSFFCFEKIFDNISIGISLLEMGKMKFFYKFQNDENPEAKDWEDFYDSQGGLLSTSTSYGTSFFIRLGASGPVHAKISYYLDWMGVDPYYGSDNMYYRPNNLFFSLNFVLGEND